LTLYIDYINHIEENLTTTWSLQSTNLLFIINFVYKLS